MTKFIKLPTHVQEMISLQTCTLIQDIKVKAIQRIKDEGVKDTTEFILSCLTVEVMEQKATAYFREMELIELIRSIPRFNINNYRDGEFGIDSERVSDVNGDYIDSCELDIIIEQITELRKEVEDGKAQS